MSQVHDQRMALWPKFGAVLVVTFLVFWRRRSRAGRQNYIRSARVLSRTTATTPVAIAKGRLPDLTATTTTATAASASAGPPVSTVGATSETRIAPGIASSHAPARSERSNRLASQSPPARVA